MRIPSSTNQHFMLHVTRVLITAHKLVNPKGSLTREVSHQKKQNKFRFRNYRPKTYPQHDCIYLHFYIFYPLLFLRFFIGKFPPCWVLVTDRCFHGQNFRAPRIDAQLFSTGRRDNTKCHSASAFHRGPFVRFVFLRVVNKELPGDSK